MDDQSDFRLQEQKLLSLRLAARAGDITAVRSLLASGPAVDPADPLPWALDAGQTRVAEILLDTGIDLNKRLPGAMLTLTPLGHAIFGGLETIELLLSRGADPSIPSGGVTNGRTVAHQALEQYRELTERPGGAEGVVRLLGKMLDAGVRPNQAFGQGITLLRLAITSNATPDVLSLLADRGARLSIRDKNGHEPIHVAAMTGNATAVEFLLKRGIHPDDEDHDGMTALHHAKSAAIAQLLLDHGADLELRDVFGRTPLLAQLQAMKKDSPIDAAVALVEAGARMDVQDFENRTAEEIIRRKSLKQFQAGISAMRARTAMKRTAGLKAAGR